MTKPRNCAECPRSNIPAPGPGAPDAGHCRKFAIPVTRRQTPSGGCPDIPQPKTRQEQTQLAIPKED